MKNKGPKGRPKGSKNNKESKVHTPKKEKNSKIISAISHQP